MSRTYIKRIPGRKSAKFSFESQEEFIIKFNKLMVAVNKDPVNNFFKHPWFLNFQASPAQTVALKTIFKKPLDPFTKFEVYQEDINELDQFDLSVAELTEIELYELMTGRVYDLEKVNNPDHYVNMIDLIIGRRGGKCQAINTTVLLANGSLRKIQTLVDSTFLVPSYNNTTEKIETKLASCINNGLQPVIRINTKSGLSLDRTKNHQLLTNEGWLSQNDGLKSGLFIKVPKELPFYNSEDLLNRSNLEKLATETKPQIPEELFTGSKAEITFYLNLVFHKHATSNKQLKSFDKDFLLKIKHLLQRLGKISHIGKAITGEYTLTAYTLAVDYWWDEILSIEDLGELPTYGLSVEDNQTYITDVIEHNTTVAGGLATFFSAATNWNPYLYTTPHATVILLSHKKEGAIEILDMIKGFVNKSPILKHCIDPEGKQTDEQLSLSFPYISAETGYVEPSKVVVKAGVASSKTTRGTAACAVLCDEISYWQLEEALKETDVKILNAVRQNMKQFGKKAILVKLSSPGIKQGVLYNEHQRWLINDLPSNYQIFKAPSWVWNTILSPEEYIIEWQYDADNFDAELRANFVDAISDFFNVEMLELCVAKNITFLTPEVEEGEVIYKAAIDAAFKNDTFTFSIVGHTEAQIRQYVIKGWEGEKGPDGKKISVKVADIAEYCKNICQQYGIEEISADQFAFQPLKELFEQQGLTLVERPFSQTYKKKIYFNLKRLVNSGQIQLLDHPKMLKELKQLIVEQTSNGNIKIGHPNGGSDDYADSLAIAAYEAVESCGVGTFNFDATLPTRDFGIDVDKNGTPFTAPSPEMLADSLGLSFTCNGSSFVKHPITGKLIPIDELKDKPGDDGFVFSF